MSVIRSLSELAEKVAGLHAIRFRREQRVTATFETPPGLSEAEVAAAYAELVAAGLMHPVHSAGVGTPGTFCLSARGVLAA